MEEKEITAESFTGNIGTRFIGQRVLYFPRLASTMDLARGEARKGAGKGLVVIADEQTAGRGRKQRSWLSPRGCIAMSVVLRPRLAYLPSLIMVASLAVVRSIRLVTGLEPRIKWPNDVIINGKKVCGVLIENEVTGARVDYSIIGRGINVNLSLSGFPDIMPIATSLSDELGRDVSRPELVICLLTELEKLYLELPDTGCVYNEWRDMLATLGRQVVARMGDKDVYGIAESADSDGSLLIRQRDGAMFRIVAGDVTLR